MEIENLDDVPTHQRTPRDHAASASCQGAHTDDIGDCLRATVELEDGLAAIVSDENSPEIRGHVLRHSVPLKVRVFTSDATVDVAAGLRVGSSHRSILGEVAAGKA